MIVIIDFGSQYTHLISRKLKELGYENTIVLPDAANAKILMYKPHGIILSGSPFSVYEKNAPTIDAHVFDLRIPILGNCYGIQLIAHLLGGKVISGRKEYGPARLSITNPKSPLAKNLPKTLTVWMSHGDEVINTPKGFTVVGSTEHVPYAFIQNLEKQIFGVQFHPEVDHTEFGKQILQNFAQLCKAPMHKHDIDPQAIVESIQKKVSGAYVIGAVSGGVDSTVAGVLTAKAIGKQFIPIYVDNGLMRDGTIADVKNIFRGVGIEPIILDKKKEMVKRLQGIIDPEKKRKVIGKFYIEAFDEEVIHLKNKNVQFLLQGTIYSDVIESRGTKHADKIKSHHNVGALPEHMKLQLLEPLREFYKDEVRKIGAMIGIPDEFVQKQKFPGPGFGIRIRGEVTQERLAKAKQADDIILEELIKVNLLHTVFHSFPVMTGAYSTAVKGDGRVFAEIIALRITTSTDEMTSGWAHLPYDILQRISSRIVNEVPNISRVVYDITTKPPATMEWE